jgi:hypothetical protein
MLCLHLYAFHDSDCSEFELEGKVKAECHCKDNWIGPVCNECDVRCVHGSVNEDCSECVCWGNWKGDSCSGVTSFFC